MLWKKISHHSDVKLADCSKDKQAFSCFHVMVKQYSRSKLLVQIHLSNKPDKIAIKPEVSNFTLIQTKNVFCIHFQLYMSLALLFLIFLFGLPIGLKKV